jgi:hypothetical protein
MVEAEGAIERATTAGNKRLDLGLSAWRVRFVEKLAVGERDAVQVGDQRPHWVAIDHAVDFDVPVEEVYKRALSFQRRDQVQNRALTFPNTDPVYAVPFDQLGEEGGVRSAEDRDGVDTPPDFLVDRQVVVLGTGKDTIAEQFRLKTHRDPNRVLLAGDYQLHLMAGVLQDARKVHETMHLIVNSLEDEKYAHGTHYSRRPGLPQKLTALSIEC